MKIEKVNKNKKVLVNNDFFLELKEGLYYELGGEDFSIAIYNYDPEKDIEGSSKESVDLKISFLRDFPTGHGPKDVNITSFINGLYENNDAEYKKKYVGQIIAMVGKYKGITKILLDNDDVKTGYCSNKSVMGDVPLLNQQLIETFQGYILTSEGFYIVHSHYNYFYGMPDILEEIMDEILLSVSTSKATNDKIIKNESDNKKEEIKETNVDYDECLKLIKDSKNKFNLELKNFKELLESKLQVVRYDEYSYDIPAVVSTMIDVIKEDSKNYTNLIELLDKELKDKLKSCNDSSILQKVRDGFNTLIDKLDGLSYNFKFDTYKKDYKFFVPYNINSIKKYWENKYNECPDVKEKIKKEQEEARIKKEQEEKKLKEYEEKKKLIEKENNEKIEKYKNAEEEKLAELIDEKKKDFSIKINKLNKKKEELEVELKNEKERLNNAGLFNISLKKTTKEKICILENEILKINDNITDFNDECDKEVHNLKKVSKNRIEEYEKKIKNNNPLPNKPGSEKQENNDNFDNDDFDIILSTLKMLKKAVTVSELQEASNELDRYSSQKIFALLAELVRKGKVKKTIIYKKSYYEIEQ